MVKRMTHIIQLYSEMITNTSDSKALLIHPEL